MGMFQDKTKKVLEKWDRARGEAEISEDEGETHPVKNRWRRSLGLGLVTEEVCPFP
jgi:hypothetical protein